MTAEKKPGLLPRLVGGAKQRAEGMVSVAVFYQLQKNIAFWWTINKVRHVLSFFLSLALLPLSTFSCLARTSLSCLLFFPNLYLRFCSTLAASLAAQVTRNVGAARETVRPQFYICLQIIHLCLQNFDICLRKLYICIQKLDNCLKIHLIFFSRCRAHWKVLLLLQWQQRQGIWPKTISII